MERLKIEGLDAPNNLQDFVRYKLDNPDSVQKKIQEDIIKEDIVDTVLRYLKVKHSISNDYEALLMWKQEKEKLFK